MVTMYGLGGFLLSHVKYMHYSIICLKVLNIFVDYCILPLARARARAVIYS